MLRHTGKNFKMMRVINRTATVFLSYNSTLVEKAGVEPAASAFYCNALAGVTLRYDTSKNSERVKRRKENKHNCYPLQDSNLHRTKYFFSTTSFKKIYERAIHQQESSR
jgi:hypothetical protein